MWSGKPILFLVGLMRIPTGSLTTLVLLACLPVFLAAPFSSMAQQQQVLGSIIGHVRVARGDVPPQPVLVTLEFRGAAMDSMYTDSQGTFGFHHLGPNPYTISVNDEQYQPVQKTAIVEPNSLTPLVFVDIALAPKAPVKSSSDVPAKPSGSNPNIIDVREYSRRFPKSAVKEFEKGLGADAAGKRDGAIRHYQKAIAVAPDFYLAHNNLGSDYLSNSDFPAARREFEEVIRFNQSDAAAYFNLSNVCMLMGVMSDAHRYLDEAMRRQPDSALGRFLLATLNIRLGKYVQAEAALLEAIQLDPVMAQPRLQLVNLFLQQGRKADAVAQLHDFVTVLPASPFNAQARKLLQRLETSSKAPAVSN
jgi:Flp pilus assembly protein TadD